MCIRPHIRYYGCIQCKELKSIIIQKDFIWSVSIWSTGFVCPCCVRINLQTLAAPENAYLIQIPLIIIFIMKYV